MTESRRSSALLWSVICAPALFMMPGASADDADRVGHFATADGTLGFVLDLSGETPRQRYDNSPEVLLLKPVAAARGDTIYRKCNGNVAIRGTPFGALTYYGPGDQTGVAMVRIGAADPLEQKQRTTAEVLGLGALLAQKLSHDYHLAIKVFVPGVEKLTEQEPLNAMGDAIENTQVAVERIAAAPNGAKDLAQVLGLIRFDFAKDVGVSIKARTLSVRVTPAKELLGRPCSYAISDLLALAIRQVKSAQAGVAAASSSGKESDQHSFDIQW